MPSLLQPPEKAKRKPAKKPTAKRPYRYTPEEQKLLLTFIDEQIAGAAEAQARVKLMMAPQLKDWVLAMVKHWGAVQAGFELSRKNVRMRAKYTPKRKNKSPCPTPSETPT